MAAKSKKSNSSDKKTETMSKRKEIKRDKDENIAIEEQLDRADIALKSNQEQTLKLHSEWRAQVQ
jgi:hypothetical protein